MIRAGSFLLGVLLIRIAVASPLASGDAHMLTIHMVQHLLLMSLAPPLIWLSDPMRLLPSRLISWLGRVGTPIGHPVVCWIAATTVLVAWHVPALLAMSVHSNAWHAIEQASFLAGGLLFWWPVVRPWPISTTEPQWSIVLYLFFATLPCDALAGFLVFSERIAYPMYGYAHQPGSLSVLDDQQLAGALMWTIVTIVYLVAAVIVGMRSVSAARLPAVQAASPSSPGPAAIRPASCA